MFPAAAATAASVGILGKGPHVFRLRSREIRAKYSFKGPFSFSCFFFFFNLETGRKFQEGWACF